MRCSRPWSSRSPSCSSRFRARSLPAVWITRASRCSPGTPRAVSPSRRSSSGRTSASQEVLDRLAGREDEVKAASGLPFDPYFSAAKLAWLLEHDEDVGRARDAGTLRMGTVDSFLSDRLGAGFATDPSTASRTQLQRIDAPGDFDPALCATFGVPREVLPQLRDTAGDLGVLRHPSWPARAAPLRADGRSAGGPRRGGSRCAGPRQGDLWHRRLRPRARRRGCPGARRRPAADGRLADQRAGGVRARRRRLRGRRNARVDVSRARARR